MFFSFRKTSSMAIASPMARNHVPGSPAVVQNRMINGSSPYQAQAEWSSYDVSMSMSGGYATDLNGGFTRDRYAPLMDDPLSKSVMELWLPKTQFGLMALYRKIHLRDAIAGPVTDLMSHLPFSSYILVGDMDKEIEEIYQKSVDNLNLAILMPELCAEYLSIGRSINSLIFDAKTGCWSDILSLPAEACWIEPRYVRGYDPKINFIPFYDIKRWARSNDPRDIEAQRALNPHYLDMLQRGSALPLNPLTTLYVPRKSHPNDLLGTSWYSRLLPLFILDQILMSGTLVGAYRKQSGLMQVKAGSETWEPDPQEREALAALIQSADEDPIGSVIVTNRDVDITEVGGTRDLWKIESSWQFLQGAKLRSLGVGEAFLTSEANYNSQETTLSVFIENVRLIRNTLTYKIFDQKLFPILARVHGFVKRSQAELDHKIRTNDTSMRDELDKKLQEKIKESQNKEERKQLEQERDEHQANLENIKKTFPSYAKAMNYSIDDLIIPSIQWNKQLASLSTRDLMSNLQTLASQDIPVPISTWIAASGGSLDEYLESLKQDVEDQEKIRKYKEAVADENPVGNNNPFNYNMASMGTLNEHDRRQLKDIFLSAVKEAQKRGPLLGPAGCL